MYCRLYRQFERFRRPELLNAAKAGALPSQSPSPQKPLPVIPVATLCSQLPACQPALEAPQGRRVPTDGEVGAGWGTPSAPSSVTPS